jgi:ankyrin repeat protein
MSSFEQICEDIVYKREEAALAKLETYGEDINKQDEDGRTLLHWSITSSNKVSKKLVEMGADLNIKTLSFGWTALHRAVIWNNIKAVEFLVEAGADLSIKTGNCTRYRYT